MFPRSLIATYLTLPAAPAMVFAQGGTEAKTGYAAGCAPASRWMSFCGRQNILRPRWHHSQCPRRLNPCGAQRGQRLNPVIHL